MWDPYDKSVRGNLENAGDKIVYDKFHVIADLSKPIDEVRRAESPKLRKGGG
jgi:hypothetical protein